MLTTSILRNTTLWCATLNQPAQRFPQSEIRRTSSSSRQEMTVPVQGPLAFQAQLRMSLRLALRRRFRHLVVLTVAVSAIPVPITLTTSLVSRVEGRLLMAQRNQTSWPPEHTSPAVWPKRLLPVRLEVAPATISLASTPLAFVAEPAAATSSLADSSGTQRHLAPATPPRR